MDVRFTMRRRDFMAAGMLAPLLGSSACRANSPDRVSLLDFIPPAEHRRIAGGRSSYDCGPDLQRAVGQVTASGAILWVPRGTYLLVPSQPLDHADRSFACLAAVRIISGMRLHGQSDALFRMVEGYSSDQSPRAMAMFGTSEPVADIELNGLILDMNGRGNPISPGRADGHYNRIPQAQVFVSGGSGALAARADRVRISDTVFRDANGASCIVMGQTEDRSARLSRNWILEGCYFLENGMDTDDHSSVYAYAEDVQTRNCIFANGKGFGPTGANTAYEVHGSRQSIRGSIFKNMLRGVWVANNFSSETTDTLIENCIFKTMFYGVDFFNDRSTAKAIRRTTIRNNKFLFDDSIVPTNIRLNFKAAVQIASEFGQQDINVVRNSATKTGHAVTSAFVVITGGASGEHRHDAIEVADNQGRGLTFGSFVRTTAAAGLGRLTIVRNKWAELFPSALMAISAGDAVEHTGALQPIHSLTLGGGSVVSSDPSRNSLKPIYINAWIRSLALVPTGGYGSIGKLIALGGAARVDAINYRSS